METKNQIMLLREADIEPTENVLENALGKEAFDVYLKLLHICTTKFDLQYEWRFYKDGKAWLCKIIHKKKTIFWLSIWDKFIRTGFYFTEKTYAGIFDLPISEEIKKSFGSAKAIGKLIPLILDINQEEQLTDFREIVKYKKEL